MKKIYLLSATLVTSLALSACGGGGGGSQASTSPNPVGTTNPGSTGGDGSPATGDSGSISARFAQQGFSRYFLGGTGGQTLGNLTAYLQTTDGAVTALGDHTLSGQTAVKEINGDANFAMGRWSQGTVTSSNGTIVLDGTSNSAYHYVVFNTLAALPTTGTYQCDGGKFTAPTYFGGASVTRSSYTGAATGSATLSFSADGAAISVTINASAGGQTGSVSGSAVLNMPTGATFLGNYFANGQGMALTIGDGGGGRVSVIAPYRSKLANDSLYEGIAVFSCTL